MLPTDAVLFEDPSFKVKHSINSPTPSLLLQETLSWWPKNIFNEFGHSQSRGSVWFPFTYIVLQVYAEKYLEDQESFFKDYAEAHAKLSNLGAKFDPPEVCCLGWYIIFFLFLLRRFWMTKLPFIEYFLPWWIFL